MLSPMETKGRASLWFHALGCSSVAHLDGQGGGVGVLGGASQGLPAHALL